MAKVTLTGKTRTEIRRNLNDGNFHVENIKFNMETNEYEVSTSRMRQILNYLARRDELTALGDGWYTSNMAPTGVIDWR